MKIRINSFDNWPVWAQMFAIITGLFGFLVLGQKFYTNPPKTNSSLIFITGASLGVAYCLSWEKAIRNKLRWYLIIVSSVMIIIDVSLAIAFPERKYFGYVIGQLITLAPGGTWVVIRNWHAGD